MLTVDAVRTDHVPRMHAFREARGKGLGGRENIPPQADHDDRGLLRLLEGVERLVRRADDGDVRLLPVVVDERLHGL